VRAKVQPDITEIENELAKSPSVYSSELSFDYETEMIDLVADNNQRKVRKQAILDEIKQIRKSKVKQDFFNQFKAQGAVAQNFAVSQGDNEVLKFRKISPNGFRAITGAQAGIIFDKQEWKDHAKLKIDNEGKITAEHSNYGVNGVFEALSIKKTEAESLN
jgi:hypothetical protein